MFILVIYVPSGLKLKLPDNLYMQVKYVFMGSEQAKAYDDAINEYRAASQARNASASTGISNTVIGLLPKRQISNYFVQFRKVLNMSSKSIIATLCWS